MILRVEAVLVRELNDDSDPSGDTGFFEVVSLDDQTVNCVTLPPDSTIAARNASIGEVLYNVNTPETSEILTRSHMLHAVKLDSL